MDAPHKSSQLTWPLDLFFGESTKAVKIPGHFWNPWIIKKFNKKIMSHSSFRFFLKPRVIQLEVSKFGRFFSARCALAMQVTWSITGWQWCVFPRCCSFFWWRTDFWGTLTFVAALFVGLLCTPKYVENGLSVLKHLFAGLSKPHNTQRVAKFQSNSYQTPPYYNYQYLVLLIVQLKLIL